MADNLKGKTPCVGVQTKTKKEVGRFFGRACKGLIKNGPGDNTRSAQIGVPGGGRKIGQVKVWGTGLAGKKKEET